MTTLRLIPTNLTGTVHIPSSKSMGHREIICAALAQGESTVGNISMSKDIAATIAGMRALGASFAPLAKEGERAAFKVLGAAPHVVKNIIDCGESGSTLRFLLPVGALCKEKLTFLGSGKLPTRPLEPYYNIFNQQGLLYKPFSETVNLPLTLEGPLQAGSYTLPGDVSSQFISGLLFALPLLKEDSSLEITGKLESQSYVEMTLGALHKYGIVIEHDHYRSYRIPGGQQYKPCHAQVEGDFSQIAFWLVAGTLGGGITATGMNMDSLQGDKAILNLLQQFRGNLTLEGDRVRVEPAATTGTVIDAADCPDLIPVLTVLAAVSTGHTEIINAGRLRIKECDRLAAMATSLNKIGAQIVEKPEGLSIEGVKHFTGGTLDCWNDHRIAMSLAVASIKCTEPLILTGTECVKKSYPDFWQDFAHLGGRYE